MGKNAVEAMCFKEEKSRLEWLEAGCPYLQRKL